MTIQIKHFFDKDTSTFTYVIHDPKTLEAAVIDPVQNLDLPSGRTSYTGAMEVIDYLKQHKLKLKWILETHIHADHLTAANYIKQECGGQIAVGANIKNIWDFWVKLFDIEQDADINVFDLLIDNNQIISLGNISIKAISTPGHTPVCMSFLVEDHIFVGDCLFMPDVGTARADFPKGCANDLYDSIQKIYALPDTTKIYTCHDYPPTDREIRYVSTVGEQKEHNVFLNKTTSKQNFILRRNERDANLPVPKLLLPSIQVNLRAGGLGKKSPNGTAYIKIPCNAFS